MKVLFLNSTSFLKGLCIGFLSTLPFWIMGSFLLLAAIIQPSWIIHFKGIMTSILFGSAAIGFSTFLSFSIANEYCEYRRSHTLFIQRFRICFIQIFPIYLGHLICFWLWWYFSSELFYLHIPGAFNLSSILLVVMLIVPLYEYTRILIRKGQVENYFVLHAETSSENTLKNGFIILANLESALVLTLWLLFLKVSLNTGSFILNLYATPWFFWMWVLMCIIFTSIMIKLLMRSLETYLREKNLIMWDSDY